MSSDPRIAELEAKLESANRQIAVLQARLDTSPEPALIGGFLNHLTLACLLLDQNGMILAGNQAQAELLEVHPEELAGKNFREFLAGEDVERFEKALSGFRGDGILQVSLELVRKAGAGLEVILSGYGQPDEKGRFLRANCIAFGNTRPSKVVQALRFEQEKLASIVASVPGVILTFKLLPDGMLCIPYASPAFSDVFGLSPGDVRENILPLLDRILPEDQARLMEAVRTSAPSLQAWGLEFVYEHPTRGKIWIDGKTVPVRDVDGGTTWYGICTEITHRKANEARLQESERWLNMAEEVGKIGLWDWNLLTQRKRFSHQIEVLFGVEPGEGEIPVWEKMVHPEDLLAIQAAVSEVIQQKRTEISGQFRFRRPDGEMRWVMNYGKVLFGEGDQPALIQGISWDVTAFKISESLLNRYDLIGKNSRDILLMVRPRDGRIMEANTAAEANYGYTRDELLQLSIYDLRLADSSPVSDQMKLASRSGILFETVHRRKDNSSFPVEVSSRGGVIDGEEMLVSVIRDISQRKQIYARLEESEEMFSKAFLNSPLLMAITDMETDNYILCNEAFCSILELRMDEVIGHNAADLGIWVHPDHRAIALNIVQNEGKLKNFESVVRTKTGKIRHGIFYGEFIRLGERVLLLTIMNDVTEREQAKRALSESEEKYRSLVESQESVIVTLDAAGVVQYVNLKAAALLSAQPDQVVGRNIAALLPLERFKDWITLVQQVIASGTGVVKEADAVLDGRPVWLRTSIQPVRDAEGTVKLATLNAVDITAIKESERLLEEKVVARTVEIELVRQRLELALRAGQMGVWDLDLRTDQLVWNRQLHLIYGLDDSALVENLKDWERLVHPDDLPTERERLAAALRAEKDYDSEFRILWPDHSEHYIKANAIVLRDEQNQPLRMIGIDYDITSHKKADQVLERSAEMTRTANLELERVIRMKDSFLATMSHELRTPLTSILGISETLQLFTYGVLTDRQLRALANIETSGRHLLDLINDILDISKVEAGMLEINIESCQIEGICQSSLQMVKGLAVRKGLRLDYSTPSKTLRCEADVRRLKQILVNLLSNAIKFTAEGGSIGLEVRADLEKRRLTLSVWDTGIGISDQDMPKLFHPFIQLDTSLSRHQPGTGLGLVLVKRLAELHGGRIEVASQPGQGSRFTVCLPWNPWEGEFILTAENLKAQHSTVRQVLTAGRKESNVARLMVVEDNEINRGLVCDYLRAVNFKAIGIEDAQVFFDRAPAIMPDLVLMDIQMPGMDGLEAIRKMRKHPNTKFSAIPVIALTALTMPGDCERCLEAGADDYISKPIDFPRLLATIRERLNRGREGEF